jgi:hypothetical protein
MQHEARGPGDVGTASMRPDQLRALQSPLKERYRAEPAAALVTLRAEATLGEGISCSVATGRAIAEAGLHPAAGGDGLSLCSGDMLLEALAACAGVTLRAVATSLDIPMRTGVVHAEGDLDFRGTLAVRRMGRSASPPSEFASSLSATRAKSNSKPWCA